MSTEDPRVLLDIEWANWKFHAAFLSFMSDPDCRLRLETGSVFVVWAPRDAEDGRIDEFKTEHEVDRFLQTGLARGTPLIILREPRASDSFGP